MYRSWNSRSVRGDSWASLAVFFSPLGVGGSKCGSQIIMSIHISRPNNRHFKIHGSRRRILVARLSF